MKNEEHHDDEVIGGIHRTRAELLAEHDGSIHSLAKYLRGKQDTSGREVIERLNGAPSQPKAGHVGRSPR